MKRCGRCSQEKALSHFGRNRSKSDGLNIYCNECSRTFCRNWRNANTKQMAELKKRYRDLNRSEIRDYMLRFRYGITLEQRDAMEAEQGWKCKICFRSGLKLVVDHCHATGRIRGLLCSHCNRMLGMAGDSVSVLKRMIDYLNEGNF